MKLITSIITIMILLTCITTAQNYSLSFDGSDDYVSVPSNSVYTVSDNYTIETWINSSSDGLQSLIQGWYGFGFQIYLTNGTIHFVLREPSGNGVGFSSTTQIADGNWHHIAAVLNEDNVSVFVDGALETEGTFNNTVTGNGSDNLSFGHSPWASEYYSGLLDEIRIWNTTRTQSEIQNNMSTELLGNETGLVGYWNFNDGTGSTLTDQTSNGNDGTISGATWSTDVPVSVTFNFDLTNQDVSDSGVHIAGDFQEWNPGSTEMTDTDGDNIFTYTRIFSGGTQIEYKFINGNSWNDPHDMLDNTSCGESNRQYTVPYVNVILDPVCMSSCDACESSATNTYSLSFDYMSGYAVSSLTSDEIFGDNYTFTVESWYKNDGVDSGNNQGYDDGANIVSNYKRSGGGDPYNNFTLSMVPENHGDIGTFNMQGAGSVERYDDGQWHHVVGIIEKTSENSATSILYVDGEFISQYELGESDFISSYNKIYINNHSPFAGDHMQDCSVAGIRVSSGKRYSENFSPEFPLSTDSETIFNLDFSSGDGSTLGDLSSNGHHFEIQGNATWNTDVPEETNTSSNSHSLSFDGVDDYATIPSSNLFNNLNDFSFSIWVKIPEDFSTISNNQFIINKDHYPSYGDASFSLRFQNGGDGLPDGVESLAWLFDPDGNNGGNDATVNIETSNLLDNQWHYVSCTRNQSTGELKLYLDGNIIDSTTTLTNTISSPNGFVLGSHVFTDRSFLDGNIDKFNFWNRTLTQSEIQSYMITPPTGSETGLVGYWNFNEGDGTTLTDQTSNGNDGTIYGATWSTDVPYAGTTTTTSALTWSVQAQASLGSYNDNDNYLGVASDATNTFDASYDVLEPPASPGSSVSLYFPHEEWDYLLGDNFSTDARPEVTLTDTMQVWDFEVSSTDGGETTLTFAFTDVPDVPVILENTATGARETLSNNSTYTFTTVADSAHPFRVSIGDTTSPSLTLGSSCSGPAILISDSTYTLGWTSTDGFDVDSVLVSFSSDSGTTYTLQAALGTVSGYDWTVPDVVVMTGGKFKIKSQDYAGNSVEKVSDYVFAIAGDSLSSAVTVGWTLWGAPIDPANDTMSANLSDDFSDYWDTFDYVDNGYTYDGILLESEGYWLAAAQSATIDVQGTPITSDFTMSLSQGWELISNPLVLDISVDSLTFTKDDETKTHAEAVTAGWVNSIYGYNGTGYTAASTFSPWSGYWMAVLETDVEMIFPIHRHDGSDNSRSRDEDWMIAFDAEVEGANDEMMRIGYTETATDGFDAEHDAVNPPNPPGPVYISLFTNHPEWDYILGDKFTKDIRAEVPENGYQEWILSMESSESETQISWTFENVPDEYDIGYSINDGLYFEDMRSVSTTTLSVSTEIIVRVGTQVLGIGDEPIPEVFALHQNYPNPFNPTTQIRYDLPEDANVNIIIYDIMGRSIRSLVNSQQTAGYRSIQWNATNNLGEPVSAGMYIYMIQTGEFRQTRKMVLLK